jgi:erythromycin esterase-like protein
MAADTNDAIKRAAFWFEEDPDGFGPLLEQIGDADVVLIGEASHGTKEFYRILFHDIGIARFALLLHEPELRAALQSPRLERAIGVIYRPDSERVSHYFPASLPDQFDAVVHVDETHALHPLERWSHDELDLPETYPSAL